MPSSLTLLSILFGILMVVIDDGQWSDAVFDDGQWSTMTSGMMVSGRMLVIHDGQWSDGCCS